MKKPNTPPKWSSRDKSQTVLTSVPKAATIDKTGARVANLPSRNDETSRSHSAPADDARDGKR